jgi:hypothetical protein
MNNTASAKPTPVIASNPATKQPAAPDDFVIAGEEVVVAPPPALKKKDTSEFIVLVRHPQNRTLHALLAPKKGAGVLAVFESPELASVQIAGVNALQNKQYYIIPVE